MAEIKPAKDTIVRFQSCMSTIRTVLGWSSDYLAEILDVSRATIVNLEKGHIKMTVMHYLAIRPLFETEIKSQRNVVAEKLLTHLVDNNDIRAEVASQIQEQISLSKKLVGLKPGMNRIAEKAMELLRPLLERAEES